MVARSRLKCTQPLNPVLWTGEQGLTLLPWLLLGTAVSPCVSTPEALPTVPPSAEDTGAGGGVRQLPYSIQWLFIESRRMAVSKTDKHPHTFQGQEADDESVKHRVCQMGRSVMGRNRAGPVGSARGGNVTTMFSPEAIGETSRRRRQWMEA